jgi:cyclohexanecarboxylate-CoA ligase/acyl-CoA synthetase
MEQHGADGPQDWSESGKPAFFRRRGWWRDETVSDWLAARQAEMPEAPALVDAEGTLGWGALGAAVDRLAAGFAAIGVAHGDVVAVQLPNSREFVLTWLALAARGAILQTVHLPYGPAEVEPLLRHSGAKAAIALGAMKDRTPAAELVRLMQRLPALRCVVAVGAEVAGATPFAALARAPADRPADRSLVRATDAYVQLYTSGTTAAPKGVRVTYNHFLGNARLCAAELGLGARDRVLCAAPFTHLYGLYALELGLAAGAAACLLPLFTPAGFAAACRALGPTIIFAGPAHVAGCFQQDLLTRADIASLRIAVLSGSTVPSELSAALEARLSDGGKVLQAWGMTELQFGACSRPGDARDIRFATIGSATPGTQMRIADAEGRILTPGEAGELQIRGCSVFSGYVGVERASSGDFTADGWFRTGDLARMDAAGHVTLTGRLKDLINRGGIKINPIDVEVAISAHQAVAQVAVAPIPDAVLGEKACCFVVLRPGGVLDLDGLRGFLADRGIAKAKWPERLEIVPEMPMTPTRKIMKGELVRRLMAAHADTPDTRESPRENQ